MDTNRRYLLGGEASKWRAKDYQSELIINIKKI